MKRTAIDHPKMKRLGRILKLEPWGPIGIMESLWHFCAKSCPRGDIGKWGDDDIAEAVGWSHDSAELVKALLACRFLDESKDHRLLVHDWHDHCEDSIHLGLARRIEYFADGSMPSLARFRQSDRDRIESEYARRDAGLPVERQKAYAPDKNSHAPTRDEYARTHTRAHKSVKKNAPGRSPALPCPASALPLPCPAQAPAGSGAETTSNGPSPTAHEPEPTPTQPNRSRPTGRPTGVYARVSEEVLRDTGQLLSWIEQASHARDAKVSTSERDRLWVFTVAECCLEHGEKPAAMFVSMIRDNPNREGTNMAQEDRATKRIKAHPGYRTVPSRDERLGPKPIGEILGGFK